MKNTKLVVLVTVLSVLVVLVVLNTAVFVVRDVNVYCYNADDDAFQEQVLTAANIRRGQNMFVMSEKTPTERIEEQLNNAKVVNIERKFPSGVLINVVKLLPHSYVPYEGQYIILDNAGKILDIADEAKFLTYNMGTKTLIELRLSGTPAEPVVGEPLGLDSAETEVYTRLLRALERVNYRTFDAVALVAYIDLTAFRHEEITMETVGSGERRGDIFRLIGTGNLDMKVHYTVSFYLKDGDVNRTEKVITASNNSKGGVDITWDDRE